MSNLFPDTVSLLRSRNVTTRFNRFFQGDEPATACEDPRRPARYRLYLPAEPFPGPTQVAIGPATAFEPAPEARKDAAARGRYLALVTEPAALLRDGVVLPNEPGRETMLTLRLSERDPDLLAVVRADPERLRVFRRDPTTGWGVALDLAVKPRLVDFQTGAEGDSAVTFPIPSFATYVVAVESDRPPP